MTETNERAPSLRTELVAGVTTFFTMAYIVVVNPLILANPKTGMPFGGVLTATVLVCFTMTLLMGLYARLPFAVVPGMGLSAGFRLLGRHHRRHADAARERAGVPRPPSSRSRCSPGRWV
jgi:AGZA family xanthine/uracil permease-like MFS transporter